MSDQLPEGYEIVGNAADAHTESGLPLAGIRKAMLTAKLTGKEEVVSPLDAPKYGKGSPTRDFLQSGESAVLSEGMMKAKGAVAGATGFGEETAYPDKSVLDPGVAKGREAEVVPSNTTASAVVALTGGTMAENARTESDNSSRTELPPGYSIVGNAAEPHVEESTPAMRRKEAFRKLREGMAEDTRTGTQWVIEGAAKGAIGMMEQPIAAVGAPIKKVAGDLAGLGAVAAGVGGALADRDISGINPDAAKRKTEEAVGSLFDPHTDAGKALADSSYNPVNLIGGAVAAAGKGAREVAGDLSDSISRNAPRVKQAWQDMWQEGVQQALGIGLTKLGERAETSVESRKAGLASAQKINSLRDATRDEIQAAGYRTPAEHGPKRTFYTLFHGDDATSAFNEPLITRNALSDISMKDGAGRPILDPNSPLDQGQISSLVEKATDRYKQMAQAAVGEKQVEVQPAPRVYSWQQPTKQTMVTGLEEEAGPYRTKLQSTLDRIESRIAETPALSAQLKPLAGVLKSEIARANFTPATVLDDIMEMRAEARRAYSNTNATPDQIATATGKKAIANELEKMFESHFQKKGGKEYEQFVAARKDLAKLNLLEDAANPATGMIDARVIGAYDAANPGVLDGNMKTIAKFAQTYPGAVQPQSFGAAQLGRFDINAGIHSLFGGEMATAGSAVAAARFGAPSLAKWGAFQQKTPSYKVGAASETVPFSMQAQGAGVGAAAAGHAIQQKKEDQKAQASLEEMRKQIAEHRKYPMGSGQ